MTAKITRIIKRQGNLVAYDRDRIVTAIFRALVSTGCKDRQLAERLGLEVERALLDAHGAGATPSIEEIQDIVEKVLLESGHGDTARAYMEYRRQRAQARATRAYSFEVTDNIPYKKIYEVLCWNMAHGCDSVPALNDLIGRGEMPPLIKNVNRRYVAEVGQAARLMLERRGEVRLVIVAGPSSSGKTTTTMKLEEHLRQAGVELQTINVDNYFFDRERNPRDEFGDYDYESPHALDLTLINDHLEQLLAGRTVRAPHYDFKTGRRRLDAHAMTLRPNQVLLLDSLHGLYDAMTASIPPARKFRLYIETLGQFRAADSQFMRWADHRLLRRMIRDNAAPQFPARGLPSPWRYVRRSRLQHHSLHRHGGLPGEQRPALRVAVPETPPVSLFCPGHGAIPRRSGTPGCLYPRQAYLRVPGSLSPPWRMTLPCRPTPCCASSSAASCYSIDGGIGAGRRRAGSGPRRLLDQLGDFAEFLAGDFPARPARPAISMPQTCSAA